MKRSSKSSETDKNVAPTPMDPSVREHPIGEPKPNAERPCWAIQTLNEEVWALFPETPVEYSEVNGRNTALAVTYDLSSLDAETDRVDALLLFNLLGDEAYNADPRIAAVITDTNNASALVVMHPNARTQDRRDPFGLVDALDILTSPSEVDGGGASETSPSEVDGGGASDPIAWYDSSNASDSLDGGGA